jgi:hypothetical protein
MSIITHGKSCRNITNVYDIRENTTQNKKQFASELVNLYAPARINKWSIFLSTGISTPQAWVKQEYTWQKLFCGINDKNNRYLTQKERKGKI